MTTSVNPAAADRSPADDPAASRGRYARFLVEHGVSLRAGQPLYVRTRIEHRDFAYRVGEAAYELGAGAVRYRLFDLAETAQLVRRGTPAQIALHQLEVERFYSDIVRTGGAALFLAAPDETRLSSVLSRAHPHGQALFSHAMTAAYLAFQTRAVDQRLCPFVLAPVPTAEWGARLLPGVAGDAAAERLAELFLTFAGADDPAGLDRTLASRAAALDALGIRELHVTGAGTDLRVGFPDGVRWLGGPFSTAAGQPFHPNVPSREVFTSPDRCLAEGRLAASRPLRLYGELVRDLVLEFHHGRVTAFEAATGREAIARALATDAGACRLGEIALVDQGSPIARTGLFFDFNILDENAASHVALGLGFKSALPPPATPQHLHATGYNPSAIHLDVPFGTSQTRIVATRSRRGEVVLIDGGEWVA